MCDVRKTLWKIEIILFLSLISMAEFLKHIRPMP